jgi:hypothetical protein
MDNALSQMLVFLMLLTALWIWGLVAFAGWRVRRRAASGLAAVAGPDWVVQLALKGTGLLVLAILAVMVSRL